MTEPLSTDRIETPEPNLDTAWKRAVAALPERYGLEAHMTGGRGYVRAEPPSRPGNRGPRLPRWTAGFGWPVDSRGSLAEALIDLAEQLEAEETL